MKTIEAMVEARREEIHEQYRAATKRIGHDRFIIWLLDAIDPQAEQMIRAILKHKRASAGHFEGWRSSNINAGSAPVMIVPMNIENSVAWLLTLDRDAANKISNHRTRGYEFWIVVVSERRIEIGTFPIPALEIIR